MRALVTGAAGFIGSRLAATLAASGHEVVCLDALTSYYDPGLKRARLDQLGGLDGIEAVEGNLNEIDLAPIVGSCEAIFHLAAQPGVRASWNGFEQYVADNVLATQRLLAALDPEVVQRFMFASSSSVYGQITGSVDESAPTRPYSPYGVTKLAAEALCGAYAQNFGLPVVSLRLFTVYGPGQRPDMATHRLIRASLLDEDFPMFGDGSQVRSFTYVDDVVAAALATLARDVEPGTVLNISGGATCSLIEMIETVEDLTGRAVPIDHRAAEAGDVTRTDAVIDRAQQMLDWTPRTGLRDGVAGQVEWMRDHLEDAIASR